MKPVEEGSPVIGTIDVLRPVNADRFLVSFSQLGRGLGRHLECAAVGRGAWPCLSRVGALLGILRKWTPGPIGGVLAIGASGIRGPWDRLGDASAGLPLPLGALLEGYQNCSCSQSELSRRGVSARRRW
jgi:hypothetical protein